MATIEEAWQAYRAAVAEGQKQHASGAGAEVLPLLLLRARQLLTAIDEELANNPRGIPNLEEVRVELANLLRGAATTRH